MNKYHPIKELVLVRMRTFYREPEAIFWTYCFPVILTICLGIAFRSRSPQVLAVDVENAPGADVVQAQLDADERFKVEIHDAPEARERLRLGKSDVVVRPGDTYVYSYDPSRPDAALARNYVDDCLQRAAGRKDPVPTDETEISEPGARYIDFLIPGLLGMNLMGGGLWGVGFVITDMRIKKLLKRLIATPMRRSHFLLSVIGGRMLFMVPEVLVLLGAGWLLFDMRIRGGLLTIFIVSTVGSLSFAGVGLLIASRAQKLETISGLTNLVMLPMWLCSGVFFSYERFPDAFQPFIQLLPLTHLIDSLRGIVLEGQALTSQLLAMLVLLLWGGVCYALALRWFRWM